MNGIIARREDSAAGEAAREPDKVTVGADINVHTYSTKSYKIYMYMSTEMKKLQHKCCGANSST